MLPEEIQGGDGEITFADTHYTRTATLYPEGHWLLDEIKKEIT
jgi:hypothetical protein